MAEIKVYLSPSNQEKNIYATGTTCERDQCRKIADACSIALKRSGFQVMIAQNDFNMEQRCREADKWGADCYIPIHTNAFNGKVQGTRLFCYTLKDKSYRLCQCVMGVLAPETPGKSDSIKPAPELYEVRTPIAPTCYIEVEFHDNPISADWIIKNTNLIGERIAQGICMYYEIPYNPTALWRVQVGAFSKWENANKLLKELKEKGYDGFIIY